MIDASLDLLAEQPNATMGAIAELSGLGRTTLYRHFPSRDELVGPSSSGWSVRHGMQQPR